ncbi:hypothetical protein G7092_00395 [Mucilaginibacter sp. HC2]|uniref:hypothetical protein n=1 Tax=Mucilaginibacter inviolabilis TaxID=2714892 RepID=UPI00140ABBFD|nr:hypothetical protein [Mucilaginibacter inviolabilis]NHA02228.1 hypothetical protein [Mucilaginibacter inviolabilis]
MPKPILKKATWLLFTTVCLAAIIINSCKKDSHTDQQNTVSDPVIAQAKSWYETTYPAGNGKLGTQSTTTSFDFSQTIKPDWQHTDTYTKLAKDVIEMPIDPAQSVNSVLTDPTNHKSFNNKANSRSSFLLLKDSTGYKAYIMILIGDPAYDASKLARNTYRKHDTDFSGLVLYFTPQGKYLNGYKYLNGRLINPSVTQNDQNRLKVNTTSPVIECTDFYVDTYVNDQLVGSHYAYTSCITISGGGGAGGGGGGTNPGGNNGGGGSSPGTDTPPPPPKDPCSSNGQGVEATSKLTINVVQPDPPVIDGPGGSFPPPADNVQCTVVQVVSTSYPEITLDKNGAGLCGSVGVTQVGNSWTGSVSNLSFTAYVRHDGVTTEIPVSFGTICFEIPSDGGVTAAAASEKFIAAYNLALNMSIAALHTGEVAPNSPALRADVAGLVVSNLNAFKPGSTFATGPCAGNIQPTPAPYCRN